MSNFKDLIKKDLIFLNTPYSTNEELFNETFKILYDRNIVEETFLAAIKERESIYPTGLPIPFGVAIPHTDPIHVKEPCIVVIKPENPVIFKEMGQGENDIECKFVFMLVVKNNGEQVELLQKLISIFIDEENMNILNNCLTENDLYNKIKELL